MTIQDAVTCILSYHPALDREITCDGFKCGNPQDELKGIVTTCCASVDVIRQAVQLNANLIVCHEPTFYTHSDEQEWLQGKDAVYDEKIKLCQTHGVAIWRNHDHIHAHQPDGIQYGVMKELGWEHYLADDSAQPMKFQPVKYTIPLICVKDLARFFKDKLGLTNVRVIGNLEAMVQNIVFCGHILSTSNDKEATLLLNRDDVDVLIPGEMIDWTTASYARDAGQLGKNKAIINIGHFSSEELGMKYAATWIAEILLHKIPVSFVRSADMYQYIE